jgi:pimeloyl-ACP methyl ester carboxylesterase
MTMCKRLSERVSGCRLPVGWLVSMVLLVAAACVSKPAPAPVPAGKVALQTLDKRLNAMPDQDPWKSCFRLRRRLLAEDLNANRTSWDGLINPLRTLTEDLVWRELGGTPVKADSTLMMGYYSAIDDSDQPYALHIPKEHDGATPLPLVVFMHGQGMYNSRQYYAPDIKGCYVVGPQGRGGMDWMFIAENDILSVIEHVQKVLPVDKTRIILAGGSMGGTGSWHLATRFPSRFAGFVAINGLMDVRALDAMGAPRLPQLPADSPMRFLIEDTSSYTYACNLHNVRIFAGHGTNDPINPVEGPQATQERLRELGHPEYEMHQYAYLKHGLDMDYEAMILRMTMEPAKPLWKIHQKTAWLRYGDAGWLCITGMERQLRHAEIDAAADPATHELTVTTSNVTRLELRSEHLPFSGAPSAVVIDGTRFAGGSLGTIWPLTCTFIKDPQGWRVQGPFSFTKGDVHKTADLEGPAENAYVSRFLVVAPDQEALERHDPEAVAAQAAADRFQILWQKLFGVPCRMTSANKVTAADIADSNLILYGGDTINSLTARVLPGLPVSLKDKQIRLCGKSFAGEELGVRVCYPNPLNNRHYAVLNLGTCPEAYYRINERFGHWFHWVPFFHREFYDYAIFDARTVGADPSTFQAWGYFDERWQFDPTLCFAGDASHRQVIPFRSPMQVLPKPVTPGSTLSLVDLVPDVEITLKGCLERNRTPAGGTLLIGGKPFAAGICTTAPFEVGWPCAGFESATFTVGVQWDGKEAWSDKRFETENATIYAFLDGKQVWRQSFVRDDPAETVTIPLKGAKLFTILATGPTPWFGATMVIGQPELKAGEGTNSN